MIKRNKYKMLAAALSTSFLLSACGSVNTETGGNNINLGYDGVYAQEYFEETSVTANEVVLADKNIKTDKRKKSETESRMSETVLPPNMTMDDLLNMIQINGKTLSMPTTLNDIMALGDEFSYEMAFSEYYQTPEDSIKDMDGIFYDIYYNEDKVFQVLIHKDDYTGDIMFSPIKTFVGGFGYDIINSDLSFSLSNGLTLDSTVDEVMASLGEPNNNNNLKSYDLKYLFCAKGIIYDIYFSFSCDNENFEIVPNGLKAIHIKIKEL